MRSKRRRRRRICVDRWTENWFRSSWRVSIAAETARRIAGADPGYWEDVRTPLNFRPCVGDQVECEIKRPRLRAKHSRLRKKSKDETVYTVCFYKGIHSVWVLSFGVATLVSRYKEIVRDRHPAVPILERWELRTCSHP